MTIEEKMAQAEAIWAAGPRKFTVGGVLIGAPRPAHAGVDYKGQKIPVSRSLPDDPRDGVAATLYGHQVRKHEDGTYSTLDRRPIGDSADSMRKHAARTGHIWEPA